MTDETYQRILIRMMAGLRGGVVAIALAVLVTSSIYRKFALHRPLWTQLVAYGIVASIVLTEAVLLARNRTWGWWRRPALAAALGASALAGWTLLPEYVIGSADWAFGTIGWAGVILLLDRPARYLVGFLGLHAAVVLGRLLVLGPHDKATLLDFTAASVGTIGLPLGAGLGAIAVGHIARDAARTAAEAERARTAEALAVRLHRHRQLRLEDVYRTSEPLLEGLADGSLDPGEEQVQRACAVEAARMRRLFAESDVVSDPLLHELNHCADVALRRGIVVEFDVRGSLPSAPLSVRRALTEAPLHVLSTARTRARVTMLGTADGLTVSVTADCGAIDLPEAADARVRTVTLHEGDLVWVETQWPTEQ